MLFHCRFAKEVWALGPWTTAFDPSQVTSFKSALVLSTAWINLPPHGISSNVFPWICWFIWTSRNQLLFEKKPSTAAEINIKSIRAAREWEQTQPGMAKATNKPPPLHLPPPSLMLPSLNPDLVIVNTDAAWNARTGKAGLAWVLFDHNEREMSRGSHLQEHIQSACMAEALAVRSALLHAADLNIKHIWLRSDSQVLIGALASGRRSIELYGVLSDIATISSSSFVSCRFSFIKRDLNGLADLHAKACLYSGPSLVAS